MISASMTRAPSWIFTGFALAALTVAARAQAPAASEAPAPAAQQQPAPASPSSGSAPSASDGSAPGSSAPAAGQATATRTPASPPSTLASINNATLTDNGVKDGVNPAMLRAQVMLDRVHASPGVIDGRGGENTVHALEIYEKVKGLKVEKGLDPQVWKALIKEAGGPVLQEYTLSDEDVRGPFYPDLPKDYAKLAKLKSMGFRSAQQKIAEKFHMDEHLLAALNPAVDLTKAGNKVLVTKLDEKPLREKIHRIVVDKDKSQVFGFDKKGHVIVAYPATVGSEELPSPSGTYKVKGVAWNPIYYYDPKNFIQGDNHEKLQLPPGPNNPVGSVFVALTKPTYGLHGTPDPSKIDKSNSHGCVRMTNWDATELAHLVRPGIVVHFKS